jgi:cytochrome c oxidase cbb3-type subunit 3/ubiquinol-cytochrome c reductase cytochrome c subunit
MTRVRLVLAIGFAVSLAAPGARSQAASRTPEPVAPQAAADGAALYGKYCQVCHGAALQGYGADNAPSLRSSTFLATASDGFLRAAIEHGRAGTAMAGYARQDGGPLDAPDVAALIVYIRSGTPAPKPLPRKPSSGSAAKGAELYAADCQRCHGTVEQRANAVHLANPMFLASASDAFLRVAVTQGRPGTAMDPWGGKLSPAEIEDVVAYLRSLARTVPPAPGVASGGAPPAGEGPFVENVPIVLNPHGAQADFTLREDRYVSVADVGKAYQENKRLVLIDARTTSDYARLHITGAVSIPYFDMHDLDQVPNDGTWVIAYCACPHHVSGIVVDELRKRGYPHTAVLDEGVFAWQQKGYPITAAPGQLPVAAPPPLGGASGMPKSGDLLEDEH